MKILVYGAGVIGSLYAARLREAGQEVSILARGQRLADLREHGIVLEGAITGHRTTTHVGAVQQLAPEDTCDLVIVAVPKNHVSEVLPALAANRHMPNVLFMGNNAAGPGGSGKPLIGLALVASWLRQGGKVVLVPLQYPDRTFTKNGLARLYHLQPSDYAGAFFLSNWTSISRLAWSSNPAQTRRGRIWSIQKPGRGPLTWPTRRWAKATWARWCTARP
jgi:threonine dehydrogenase-like Zn-dependent dehydrogenase